MVDQDQKIIPGTALHRVQTEIGSQPKDQEQAEFFAGDIRDVCNACDPKDKTVAALKELTSGKRPGETLFLPISDVKTIVAAACRPTKN